MDFIEELQAWASANQLGDLMVKFEEGPTDQPKRSAFVIVESRDDPSGRIDAAGQLTLWETGEFDASAETLDGETLLSRSGVLGRPGEVSDEADDLLAHLTRSSGT